MVYMTECIKQHDAPLEPSQKWSFSFVIFITRVRVLRIPFFALFCLLTFLAVLRLGQVIILQQLVDRVCAPELMVYLAVLCLAHGSKLN